MDKVRFQLDEHVPPAVAEALRQRGIDVITTREAGLLGAPDTEQLDHALRAERVVVTFDKDYLRLNRDGRAHAGIAYFTRGHRTIGQIVEALTLIFEAMAPDGMRQHVESL